jgi:RNA polymerase sigma-70 factor (ECF subfamily)
MRDADALEKNPGITRSALEAIHGQVFGWALSRSNYDRMAAEDLMQQAYIELLSGRARFHGKSTLKTFVFSIVQNLSRSRYRRLATHLRLLRAHATEFEESDAPAEPDQNDAIWCAVRTLPARQRDIIELVFCRELTIAEASTVMGVTTGTGRVHYDRAKKALREKLSSLADELN